MFKFDVKKELDEVFYFSEEAKNYFLKNIELDAETKQDFKINCGFYKLKDKNLVVNNVTKYTFKTKKQFLEVCKQVNILNTLKDLKIYDDITIFLNNRGIKIFASDKKQKRILKLTYNIALLYAAQNNKAVIITDDGIKGNYSDTIYIQKMLNNYGLNCFR